MSPGRVESKTNPNLGEDEMGLQLQHHQGLLAVVAAMVTATVVGLQAWTAMTTQRLAVSSAVTENNVLVLKEDITSLSRDLSEFYTVKQAEADFRLVNAQLRQLDEWKRSLSDRLKELENAAKDDR